MRGLLVDMFFMVTFGLSRLGVGTPLLYFSLLEPKIHWFIKTGAVVLYAVSVVWFAAVVRMFVRSHLRPRKPLRHTSD